MEDNLNGRQPQWKMASLEDNFNGRWPKWISTSMEDDFNGKWPEQKMTSMDMVSMEGDLNGRWSQLNQWTTTSIEGTSMQNKNMEDLNGRRWISLGKV